MSTVMEFFKTIATISHSRIKTKKPGKCLPGISLLVVGCIYTVSSQIIILILIVLNVRFQDLLYHLLN